MLESVLGVCPYFGKQITMYTNIDAHVYELQRPFEALYTESLGILPQTLGPLNPKPFKEDYRYGIQ